MVKAHLIGLGSGTLEFIDNIIKFYMEKGRIRKRKELCRNIPMADIEGISRVGKELSITWKGFTDIFVIEETEIAGTIFEKIPQMSTKQRRMHEDKEVKKQQSIEVNNMLSATIEITNSLFDILRSLHGWVDWNSIENFLKLSEEKAGKLTDQNRGLIELNFTNLSLAIKERIPEETSKETYNLLKLLHDFSTKLETENKSLDEIHPNYSDARIIIQAHYLLNDIILGTLVGDEEIDKELNVLSMTLDDLSKETGSKININAIKKVITKLCAEKGKESVIKKCRAAFDKQLKNLVKK